MLAGPDIPGVRRPTGPPAGPSDDRGVRDGWENGHVSRADVLRFRQSGATLVAALIAFVGAIPLAGSSWALTPVLLIPLGAGLWAWRAGTDVDAAGLRVRALLGSTTVAWSRVAELAADRRGRVSALLTDGNALRLPGVPASALPKLLAAGGQELTRPAEAGGDRIDADLPPAGGDRSPDAAQ
jgi:Zn-dependent protease with chaperone function